MQSRCLFAIVTAVPLATFTGAGQPSSPASIFGPDQGSWRLQPDGALCLQWQRTRAGQERCNELSQSGTTYVLGVLRFSVIDGNPFRL